MICMEVDGVMLKRLFYRVIVPIGVILVLTVIFRPLCEQNGTVDYWKLLFMLGIPFGIHKMFFLVLPSGYGMGETIGILALNLLIGGAIGVIILVWRMIIAVITILFVPFSMGKQVMVKGWKAI